jgi:hypothetical protein
MRLLLVCFVLVASMAAIYANEYRRQAGNNTGGGQHVTRPHVLYNQNNYKRQAGNNTGGGHGGGQAPIRPPHGHVDLDDDNYKRQTGNNTGGGHGGGQKPITGGL